MKRTTRILLVDDHEVVRHGMRALLDAKEGFDVCGEAGDGRVAVSMAKDLRPDIVVMDIGLPGLNGFDATAQILQAWPDTRVLVLSMHDAEHVVAEVVSAGASGFVLKSDAGRELVAAVDALCAGK